MSHARTAHQQTPERVSSNGMKHPPISLIASCQKKIPGITLTNSGSFYWSPQTKTIHYRGSSLTTTQGQWALLHECGHAQLNHQSYTNDMDLVFMEVAAWQAAEVLATDLAITIDTNHIDECLNTYRDWLYARSTCPTCQINSLQITVMEYLCINCSTQWFVSQSRFCRPYRRLTAAKNELELEKIPKTNQKTSSRLFQ